MKTTDVPLTIWVIYDHPEDYPDHYVVRQQIVSKGHIGFFGFPILCNTLAEARCRIRPGLHQEPRWDGDVPCIVESWF